MAYTPENPAFLVDMAAAHQWSDVQRPAVQQARWLTSSLVRADILPESFQDARVAPIVVGKVTVSSRGGAGEATLVGTGVDLDYLATPPKGEYFPHERIKDRVRKGLDGFEKTNRKRETVLFPGYVFPDVAGGTLYLDGALCDSAFSADALRPVIRRVATAYELGCICVGTTALVKAPRSFVPLDPIPSVIREALKPNTRGIITPTVQAFRQASRTIGSLSRDR